MSIEALRGCGYRKVGGLYMCGGGASMSCDRLPYELEICPVCGSGVKFTRGWTWLDWRRYAGTHEGQETEHLVSIKAKCGCPGKDSLVACPVCWPVRYTQPYGLLWVGDQFYTPQSFMQEAINMGVSRKIAAVPKKLKLGETWVLFAHIKACGEHKNGEGKIEGDAGVFYAFRPQTLELLVWESDAKPEYLEDLGKRGITPVIIPDGDSDHDPDTKTKVTENDRNMVEQTNKIAAIRASIGR